MIGIYRNENPTTKAKILKLPNFFMRWPFLVLFDRALLEQPEEQAE
jgi:hypothetical protein